MQLRVSFEFFVLMAAIVAEVIVLYLVEEPSTRLILGATLLALVVWSSARVGVIELLPGGPTRVVDQRRFVRLRSQVAQLLDEIRRLNWVAVDAERGFGSREEAIAEMDRIEKRVEGAERGDQESGGGDERRGRGSGCGQRRGRSHLKRGVSTMSESSTGIRQPSSDERVPIR